METASEPKKSIFILVSFNNLRGAKVVLVTCNFFQYQGSCTLDSKNICRILAEHMNMKHGTHREEDPEDANDDHQDMIVKGF